MRIVACGLVAGAAVLGLAPVAMADVPANTGSTGTASADSQVAPRAEVSMLAVSLTVGGAVAMTGSGVALLLTRRRTLSRRPS